MYIYIELDGFHALNPSPEYSACYKAIKLYNYYSYIAINYVYIELDGSDALHPSPDYSACYIILTTARNTNKFIITKAKKSSH